MDRPAIDTIRRIALRFWLVSALLASLALASFEVMSFPARDRTFGLFYRSVLAWQQGSDPYAVARLIPSGLAFQNLNPPIWLLVFAPLTTVSLNAAAVLWAALSFYALIGGVLLAARIGDPLPWKSWRGLALLAGPIVWETLAQGQVYPLVLVPLAGGWLLVQRGRPRLGAAHLGLAIALKPPLFLIVVALAWSDRRLATMVALASAAWFFAPLPIVGADNYLRWLAVTQKAPVSHGFNGSLAAFAERGMGHLAAGVTALLIVCLVILVSRRTKTRDGAIAIGVCGALAASPITWPTYFSLLVPALFWLRRTRKSSRLLDVGLISASVPMLAGIVTAWLPWYTIAMAAFMAGTTRICFDESTADALALSRSHSAATGPMAIDLNSPDG